MKFALLHDRIAARKRRPAVPAALPMVGIDWNSTIVVYTFDGEQTKSCRALADLLSVLGETPHRIVLESTFESYLPERRDAFIVACRQAGHDLRTVSARYTPRDRELVGLGDKSDTHDALTIFWRAAHGAHLKVPARTLEQDKAFMERAAAVRREAVIARYSGWKDEEAAEATGILDAAGVDLRSVLGNGKEYSAPVIGTLMRAARAAASRVEFERLVGLYEHGYPNKLRSDLMHWGWRNIGNRLDEVTLSSFRRACRQAYHIFKNQGTRIPAKGTDNPDS